MTFETSAEHSMIASTATEIADEFGPEYWRERETRGEFAEAFWDELGEAGFHGLLVPEEYGGAGWGCRNSAWRWRRCVPRAVGWPARGISC